MTRWKTAATPRPWVWTCGMAVISGVLALADLAQAADGALLTLPEVMRMALLAGPEGNLARARLTEQRAQSAVHTAQGAFDWNAEANGGYRRLQTTRNTGGFVTTELEPVDVLTASVGAEKLFDNGVRVRPGLIVSRGAEQSQLASALLRSQPLLQVDVPVDAGFGEPVEALRLSSARSDLAASHLDSRHGRQIYLNRVVKAAWELLAVQQKYRATLAQAAVAEEIAGRVLRLMAAREISRMAAEDVLARAELRRNAVDQAALDLGSARLDLALLLRTDESAVAGIDASFPKPAAALGEAWLLGQLADATARRLDLQGETLRIESARQRARAVRREADSRVVVQAGVDRLLLSWTKPLGENRDLGAGLLGVADVGLATLQVDELRRRIEVEVRMAGKRLLGAAQTIERTRAVVETFRVRLGLARQLVDQGQQPPSALLDAADQLGNAQRQLSDLERLYAEALADLHLATASILDEMDEPALLASAFTRLP